MAHLIEVKNVYKIYNPGENEVRALDGVSLTVDHGEFVAIIGQSGSGKSTLMNMLGCLDVIPSLNALENVELPLIYRGIGREERRRLSAAALQKVGLEKRMDHRPAEMSGGQQQRVAIARAIAAAPPVILADEPTGNLDKRSGADVMEILRGLWREGRTVILITHDPKIAESARRVVTISDGKIIGDETKTESEMAAKVG